jgi:hypothetical protein
MPPEEHMISGDIVFSHSPSALLYAYCAGHKQKGRPVREDVRDRGKAFASVSQVRRLRTIVARMTRGIPAWRVRLIVARMVRAVPASMVRVIFSRRVGIIVEWKVHIITASGFPVHPHHLPASRWEMISTVGHKAPSPGRFLLLGPTPVPWIGT